MASSVILNQKKQKVLEISEKFNKAVSAVIVDYKGISVEDDTKLRKELREKGIEYIVVKNSILKFAIGDGDLSDIKEYFEGSTAIGFSYDDVVAPAKILCEFAEKYKDHFNIKAGIVDGQVLKSEEIIAVGKLPAKEVLVAQVLSTLNAPIVGFANVLIANIRGLAIALDQISKKI
ncbi:MAG: 50S ribosomal protein L10 [Oscillospiraceae bacterium]|nr:50S ribosomal protein L10 [Oscillospiraceae bacterium]